MQQLGQFINGVSVTKDIEERLYVDRPSTVEAAIGLVRKIESGKRQMQDRHRSTEMVRSCKSQLVTKDELLAMQEHIVKVVKEIHREEQAPSRISGDQMLKKEQEGITITCMWCGDKGHYAVNCRKRLENNPAGAVEMPRANRRPIRCFYCQEEGHIRMYCPRMQKPNQRPQFKRSQNTLTVTCFSCGEVGHVRSSCPQEN